MNKKATIFKKRVSSRALYINQIALPIVLTWAEYLGIPSGHACIGDSEGRGWRPAAINNEVKRSGRAIMHLAPRIRHRDIGGQYNCPIGP